MKKFVLKLDLHDNKAKQKALKTSRHFQLISCFLQVFANVNGGSPLCLMMSTGSENIVINMELADRAIGFILSFLSLTIFTYYTFWVIILPFVDSNHFIHKYFLSQEYAILIPVSVGVALLCFLSIFIGFVMLKSKKKKA